MWRSRSLPFSGRWIVFAVAGVGMALVAILTSGGTPAAQQVNAARLALPPMPKEAVREQRRVRDRSASARAARRVSRLRHAGLGDRAAAALARRTFPQQMSAPVFSGGDLGDGARVIASRGPGKALVKDKHGKKALLVASAALEARDGRDRMAGVDLSLERSRAGIAPVNSSAPFTVDPVSAARVRFTGPDLGMRVAGAQDSPGAQRLAAHSSTAQITDDRAFFANVQRDTDAGVVPLPSGFELLLMARSQRAPQRFSLALDLPAGASLRRAVSKTPVPAGAPRSIEVVKDDSPLGYVSSPVAHDADGRGVPAKMSIEGQQIVLDVAHRGLDVRYPISIDPEMVMPSNHDMGFAGWAWGQDPAGSPWASAIDNCAVYCGLAQWLPPYAQVRHNSSAVFAYQAPAKTAITRTTFGGVAHAAYMYAGMSFTYAYQGLLKDLIWERGRFANQDGPQPDTGYALAWPNPNSYWGHTNTVWTTQTPREQNAAAFAIVARHPWGYPVIGPTSSSAATTMAWSQISISDTHPPKWHPETAAPTDSGWTDDNDAVHNRSFRATDEGLGLYMLKLTGAASINAPPPAQGTVAGDTITAKCTGKPPNAVCPTDWPTTQVGYKLNEGINTLTAQATDAVGNTIGQTTDATGNTIPGPARTWTEKIDRSRPVIESTDGTLVRDRLESDPDGAGLYRDLERLEVQVSDADSGVRSVQMLVDGVQIDPAHVADATCSTTDCPHAFSASFDLKPRALSSGDHKITIVVRDFLASQPGTETRHTQTSDPIDVWVPEDLPSVDDADTGDPVDYPDIGDNPDACPTGPDFPDFPDPDDPDPEDCAQDETDPATDVLRSSASTDQSSATPVLVGNLAPGAAVMSSPRTAAAPSTPCNLRTTVSGPKITNTARYGLSDQNSIDGEDTFANTDAVALNIKTARLVVPFNLITKSRIAASGDLYCARYQAIYDWIVRGSTRGMEMLISFSKGYNKNASTYKPSVDYYRNAIRLFMDKFPVVKLYTAWNEPNYPDQPVYENPKLAGRYWRAANGLCKSKTTVRGCRVGAGDFSDVIFGSSRGLTTDYLNPYYGKDGMGGKRPAFWAVHMYQTIRTRRYGRLERFLDWGPAQRTGALWITEAGAYRHRVNNTNLAEATGADQLADFFGSDAYDGHLSVIKRFYYYDWHGHGPGSDDTGLVTPPTQGSVPRQIYCVFKRKSNPPQPLGPPC